MVNIFYSRENCLHWGHSTYRRDEGAVVIDCDDAEFFIMTTILHHPSEVTSNTMCT